MDTNIFQSALFSQTTVNNVMLLIQQLLPISYLFLHNFSVGCWHYMALQEDNT